MSKVIEVCNGGACTSNGGSLIIRDIEEACMGFGTVQTIGCLGHCGKGPNCKANGKVTNGVEKFSRMETFLSNAISGFGMSELEKKVAKLKFKARREEKPKDRLSKIAEAFAALGPEAKAVTETPTQFAQLLILRARENMKTNSTAAAADARQAMQLEPNWAWGQATLAQALEVTDQVHDALAAMQEAIRIGNGVDKGALKRQLQRLERKVETAPPKTETPLEASTAPVAQTPVEAVSSSATVPGAGVGPLEVAATDALAKAKAKATAVTKKAAAKGSNSSSKSAEKSTGSAKPKVTDEEAKNVADPAPVEVIAPVAEEPEEVPEFQNWELKSVTNSNHDSLRMVFACSGRPPKNFNESIWHLDLLAELGDLGEEIKRAYTPVSTAEELQKGQLDLLIKVYPKGIMTQHLATLKPGSNILVSQPVQTLDPVVYREGLVMIAGGSAVTVALQVCKAVLEIVDRKNEEDKLSAPAYLAKGEVHLYLCNKTAEDVLLVEQFEDLLRLYSCFHLTHCLSQGDAPPSTGSRAKWKKGRLDRQALDEAPRRFKAVVSGPGGLCRTSVDLLTKLSRNEDDIKVLDDLPPPATIVEELEISSNVVEQAFNAQSEKAALKDDAAASQGFWFGFFAACSGSGCRAVDRETEAQETDVVATET